MEKIVMCSESELENLIARAVQKALQTTVVKQSSEESELLDIEQAAELLRVKKATIYQWTSKGAKRRVPFTRQGRKLLFMRSELLRYLKSNQTSDSESIKESALQNLKRRKAQTK